MKRGPYKPRRRPGPVEPPAPFVSVDDPARPILRRAVLPNLTPVGAAMRASADQDPTSGGSAIARIMAHDEAKLDALAMALVRTLWPGEACERRNIDGELRASPPCASCLKTVRTIRRAFDRARRVGR